MARVNDKQDINNNNGIENEPSIDNKTNMNTKDSDVEESNSLTQIGWQRSEDGSYSPNSYINRDLSLLQFHLRVLAQAASPHHPLLERLFFLIIFSSNMDEFLRLEWRALCRT